MFPLFHFLAELHIRETEKEKEQEKELYAASWSANIGSELTHQQKSGGLLLEKSPREVA